VIVYAAGACIPDENLVWCPEMLMEVVVANINYAPLQWKGGMFS
jgi:autophagy-related protein 9